ncbi:MAG: hypothetical protein K8R68_08585, partial [Bacteroidales bacterium]|nr:hypothetical protein [Bacteroidales bacterium]
HIPTDNEWKILEGTVDSQYPVGDPEWDDINYRGFDASLNLKATSGWNSGGNGTDEYGFTALPGGFRSTDSDFYGLASYGYFWSSTENNLHNAWYRNLCCNFGKVLREDYGKDLGYSARCLQD